MAMRDWDCSLRGHKMFLTLGGSESCSMCGESDDGTRPDPTQPHAYVRKRARATEAQAASHAAPRSGTHRFHALEYIVLNNGATSDEISRYFESIGKYVPPNQVASRVLELVEMGWVKDSGQTRMTRRKSPATVWMFT